MCYRVRCHVVVAPGVMLGGINLLLGMLGRSTSGMFKMTARTRVVVGAAFLLIGLALPGMVNWLIASARDANLFD